MAKKKGEDPAPKPKRLDTLKFLTQIRTSEEWSIRADDKNSEIVLRTRRRGKPVEEHLGPDASKESKLDMLGFISALSSTMEDPEIKKKRRT